MSRARLPRFPLLALLPAIGLALTGCGGVGDQTPLGPAFVPSATRGYVLISIDTLRADRLGAYGYERDTSPFFDSLAATGTLFERVAVQYPSTLTSHMSLFTGLYPQEHQVLPPAMVLSKAIETLPERFLSHGFRTSGHTEGGFMAGGYGFARGFEEFTDRAYRADTDVERTFGLGLRFLRRLTEDERFLLFLHTYAAHDPYEPPERYRSLFWEGAPIAGADSAGERLHEFNRGRRSFDADAVRYFEALYDATIRYVDDVLRQFFAQLEILGLRDQTTVIITSDHGEEFLEHGKLAHMQLYPECVMVPLLVLHPEQREGIRVPALVETIDIAPTLLELAGLPAWETTSGRSLVPYFRDAAIRRRPAQAFSQVFEKEAARTLLTAGDDRFVQVVVSELEWDPEGAWVQGSVTFDTGAIDELVFEAQSFHRPRTVGVTVDGDSLGAFEIDIGWTPVRLELPGRRQPIARVTLEADGCVSPAELGVSADGRCLSFQLRGMKPRRVELYDLERDPGARRDLSLANSKLRDDLAERLQAMSFEPIGTAETRALSPEEEATLRALGYID